MGNATFFIDTIPKATNAVMFEESVAKLIFLDPKLRTSIFLNLRSTELDWLGINLLGNSYLTQISTLGTFSKPKGEIEIFIMRKYYYKSCKHFINPSQWGGGAQLSEQ